MLILAFFRIVLTSYWSVRTSPISVSSQRRNISSHNRCKASHRPNRGTRLFKSYIRIIFEDFYIYSTMPSSSGSPSSFHSSLPQESFPSNFFYSSVLLTLRCPSTPDLPHTRATPPFAPTRLRRSNQHLDLSFAPRTHNGRLPSSG